MIVIYLEDILGLLEVDDGLIKPITLLQAFSQEEVVVGYLDVPIIVAATLNHVAQRLFIDVDRLLLFKNLQEIQRLQLVYFRDEGMALPIVVLDVILDLIHQHQDVLCP